MPIVFAENFANDRLPTGMTATASLEARYPGSRVYGLNNFPGFPMRTSTNLTGDLYGPTTLGLPIEVFTGNRIETVLELSSYGSGGSENAAIYWSLCGITVSYAAPNILINGSIVLTGTEFLTVEQLHIIVEKSGDVWTQYVYTDTGVKHKSLIAAPAFSTEIAVGGSTSTNLRMTGAPNVIQSVVVAYDTPVGTRLGNINFQELGLIASNTGDFEFSDTGFIEDVDKTEGITEDPYVQSSGTSDAITYTAQDVPDGAYTTFYIAGRSENPVQYVDVEVAGGAIETYRLHNQQALQALKASGAEFQLRTPEIPVISQIDMRDLALGPFYKGSIRDKIRSNSWGSVSTVSTDITVISEAYVYGKVLQMRSNVGQLYLKRNNIPGFGSRPFSIEWYQMLSGSLPNPGVYFTTATVAQPTGFGTAIQPNSPANSRLYNASTATTMTASMPAASLGYYALTFNGSTLRLYANGVSIATIASVPVTTSMDLIFGGAGIVTATRPIIVVGSIRVIDGVNIFEGMTSIPVPTEPWANP